MFQLIAGAVLLALALLAVVQPPRALFWMLSIPVKEWGWAFALLCLPLLWPGWIGSPSAVAGASFACAAAVLYLTPVVQAARAARHLPAALGGMFAGPGAPGGRPAPFVWKDLLLGVRAPRTPVRTVTYAVHDGVELQMDLTRPAGGAPAPAVLVIHGGAWRSGDRKQLPALNRYLTARGYVTAAINYRLAPKYRFPDAFADVKAAVAFLKEHADAFGIDPERIVLLGRSAGAQLAVATAYTLDDQAIRGVVSYYGPFGLEWGYDQDCKVLDAKTVLGDYLGGSPRDFPEVYRAASPYRLIHPRTPPLLMIQGADDTMVPPAHCYHLIEHLEAAGRPYHLVLVPRSTHASDVAFSGAFGQISTWAVERFVESVTV